MKREMFEYLMDNTPDSVVYSDTEGRYVEVSLAKAKKWGKTRREMIGKTDFDFMPEDEAEKAREYSQQVMETRQPLNCEQEVLRNGEPIWYSLSEIPWLDKEIGILKGTISVSRNITDRIEQEQKNMAMSNQILDMVKIVSHDLSSPLINISTIAKRMINGKFGEFNPEALEGVKDIFKRLLKLRGAVLDYLYKFNNLKEGQMVEKEMVDLRTDVIDEVLEELEEFIDDNKSMIDVTLGLIPEGAVTLFSSKELLKIVYRNLLTNALKHGGKGCIISFGYEDWGDRFALNVFNNGPAVPEDEIPYLFELFIQGKNVVKGNGLGIGLSTIRNMVRNLGGDMLYTTTCSDHPNFVFTIPKS